MIQTMSENSQVNMGCVQETFIYKFKLGFDWCMRHFLGIEKLTGEKENGKLGKFGKLGRELGKFGKLGRENSEPKFEACSPKHLESGSAEGM